MRSVKAVSSHVDYSELVSDEESDDLVESLSEEEEKEEEEPVQQGHFQGKAHSLSSTSDKSKTDREKRLQYFGI